MSGSFEDMIDNIKGPSLSDVKVVLPDSETFEADKERARREREQREVDEREAREREAQREVESREAQAEEQGRGEHGGVNEGEGATATVQASQAPEPTPQRDEPDEGQHSSSEEEKPEEPSAIEEKPEEIVVEEEDEQSDDDDTGAEPEKDEESVSDSEIIAKQTNPEERDRQAVELREHLLQGVVWDRMIGFSFDGKNDPSLLKAPKNETEEAKKEREKKNKALPPSRTTQIKTFPKALVDALRRAAEPAYGSGELDEASTASLLTAFVIARIGVSIPGLDANTEGLVRVFSSAEPHLVMLEDKLEDFHQDISKLLRKFDRIGRHISEIGEGVDSLETSNAYLLADRVDPISTNNVTAATIDLLDRRAQAAARKAREVSKAERRRKQYENGRSL